MMNKMKFLKKHEKSALCLTIIIGLFLSIAFVMPPWLYLLDYACVYYAVSRLIYINLKKEDEKWMKK